MYLLRKIPTIIFKIWHIYTKIDLQFRLAPKSKIGEDTLSITSPKRRASLDELSKKKFDVLIIGGGITGAGALLEAASRGYSAALIEARDFASGTSSASSKLIHGGLRYLAQGEIALVYENLAERSRLLSNAPELVSKLDFVLPIRKTASPFGPFGAPAYMAALWGYDLTGGFRIGAFHKRMDKSIAKSMFPRLRSDNFSSAFLYHDAWADDVALTLAAINTARTRYSATAANYVEAISPIFGENNKIKGYRVRDNSPGSKDGGQEFEISARTIINASGAWATQIMAQLKEKPPFEIRPAKGVHIVFSQKVLPAKVAYVLPVPNDSRTIFLLPWGDYTYVGTTDTDLGKERVETTMDDVEYLLGAVNYSLDTPLSKSDITGAWVGVRPLVSQPKDSKALSERTKDLSRRHKVVTSPEGMISITGGKLTTYRKMASDAIDALDTKDGRATKSISKRIKLRSPAHIDPQSPTPDSARKSLVPGIGWDISREDIVALIVETDALTLSDILLRRVRVGILDQRAAMELSKPVLEILGEILELTKEEKDNLSMAFSNDLARELPPEILDSSKA